MNSLHPACFPPFCFLLNCHPPNISSSTQVNRRPKVQSIGEGRSAVLGLHLYRSYSYLTFLAERVTFLTLISIILGLNSFFFSLVDADHIFFFHPFFCILLSFIFCVLSKSEEQAFCTGIVVEHVHVADLFLHLLVG